MSEVPDPDPVRCWEQPVVIPTYPVQDADPNPMFLEKRVYQGSSGKVYPNPITDRVSLQKVDATYRAIFLENEYIQLMILPEIGGRIHSGFDKTNRYDFFYHQHVIKPALVGLLGPWISGGVEFNWPQHHRPSTFMPVHASIDESPDGSRTVWLSEHDPMTRMKGMVGVCLSPGKAIVEARVRLYNRTPLPQTFLWWANVAVHVHDQYQAFFPPDVTFVADHARRAVSSFPIARNSYYGVDYRPGTDISWYKSIPVPTSYMVTQSRYDFCGGYDHARNAGIVHTSNHHIAPGKKLWTWGNAEFGHAWERHLTDNDGPYMELMAGAYTDNQPDFSWLQPYETKSFSQYWYPIQKIGPPKNANKHAAINLEFLSKELRIGVCVTTSRRVHVILLRRGSPLVDEILDLAPGQPFLKQIPILESIPHEFRLSVLDSRGHQLIAYQPREVEDLPLPDPAAEPLPPEQMSSVEELYIAGLHLVQYRHATRSPQAYWREGLRRDPEHAQLNNAIGLAHFRNGEFAEAENHFARAVHRLTLRNPNPCDGEPLYNLGLVRLYQGKTSEACDAFHKSIWNYAWKSPGYYALASISVREGNLPLALEQVEASLLTNVENLKARALKASLLRRLGRDPEARKIIDESLSIDRLDFRTIAEQFLLTRDPQDLRTLTDALERDVQTLLDVGYDLAWSGLADDAHAVLLACANEARLEHPMLWYTLSWLAAQTGDDERCRQHAARAESASPLYCFPARLEEMIVLEDAVRRNPSHAKALYYLGNLYYDKRRYKEAIACWRQSVQLDSTFSIPFRNLGIAEFNVLHDPAAADRMYARAFEANPEDARVLYEWDQLTKRAGLASPQQRLRWFEKHQALVERRDDLAVEHITLLNHTGRWHAALQHLDARHFSPWEGGEGLVSAQYVHAHRALGRAALEAAEPEVALRHFDHARYYPENLGEGKHLLTLERDLDYLSGLAAGQMGDAGLARHYFNAAAAPLPNLGIHSYFQALALIALGNREAGQAVLTDLAAFAKKLIEAEPRIDYFATSLPDLLLFDDDLCKRNRVQSLLLAALAAHGLGHAQQAIAQFEEVLALDPSHLFATDAMNWMKLEISPAADSQRRQAPA